MLAGTLGVSIAGDVWLWAGILGTGGSAFFCSVVLAARLSPASRVCTGAGGEEETLKGPAAVADFTDTGEGLPSEADTARRAAIISVAVWNRHSGSLCNALSTVPQSCSFAALP